MMCLVMLIMRWTTTLCLSNTPVVLFMWLRLCIRSWCREGGVMMMIHMNTWS